MKIAPFADLQALPRTECDLTGVLDQYLAALRRGEQPSKDELLRAHPEVADELAGCLHTLDILEGCIDFDAEFQNGAPPATRTLGDYRIIREVGRGGMGIVFEAEQISLGRRVALKVLPFAAMLDERQLQRFKNEARAAASLDHANIVEVYGVGCERGVHYFAMRYVEGQTLAAVIEGMRNEEGGAREGKGEGRERPEARGWRFESRPGPTAPSPLPPASTPSDTLAATLSTVADERLDPHSSIVDPSFLDPSSRDFYRRIAELGIQAAEALDHAHQLGIVHRDIKPANLLLEVRNAECGMRNACNSELRIPNSTLYISDFGLARLPTDAGMTMTGDLLGTLRYMSPEQALAKRITVDHRTDIYSLGITLYELLTLQPAFPATDRQTLLRQIANDSSSNFGKSG